jgi:glutathione S-transferase
MYWLEFYSHLHYLWRQHVLIHRSQGFAPPLSFSAFAYAGQRQLKAFRLDAIREPPQGPFDGALGFTSTVDSATIVQWLANSHTKEALALKDGNTAAAERYRATRARVEDAIREVIGEDIRFEMSYEPLGITLRRGGVALDLDLLSDGVKSIVSWVADLLSRLDRIPWEGDLPLHERRFLLLLDEVDIHLHPSWQRKVLPMVQRLCPSAQVVCTTHSPFVVGSVADAWVYRFEVRDGDAQLADVLPSQAGHSYSEVLRAAFQVTAAFDVETERALDAFYALRDKVLGGDHARFEELRTDARTLAARGSELGDIVTGEVLQVAHRIGRAA